MSLVAWPLQQAVVAALKAALPVPVLDHVPPETRPPYVKVGEFVAADTSTKVEEGEETSLTIHVWSIYKGSREVREIMGQIKAALHLRPLTLSGHALVTLRFVSAQDFDDPDGITRHGVVRLRALTNKL